MRRSVAVIAAAAHRDTVRPRGSPEIAPALCHHREMASLRPRLTMAVALVAAAAVIAAIVLAGLVIGPQIIRAAATNVATSATTITLTVDGAQATIPVDEGWSYVVGPFDDGEATLRSPDGSMTVQLTAVAGIGSDADAERAASARSDAPLGAFDREPVGSATVLHARAVGEDVVVGAVVSGDAAVVFRSSPGAGFDAELAQLLSHIEVAQ